MRMWLRNKLRMTGMLVCLPFVLVAVALSGVWRKFRRRPLR